MDLSTKYRTRIPPKEHEEAVRMLLEGISAAPTSKQQAPGESVHLAARKEAPAPASVNNNNNRSYDYTADRKSINSTGDSNSNSNSSEVNGGRITTTGMRSKSTSTSESVLSSASFDRERTAAYREPIPSRTIAVQCDLKSSSSLTQKRVLNGANPAAAAAADYNNQFDTGEMQASSISSTRYGFYNFSAETLENRRKLQRSLSSRDITNPTSQPNGKSNTRLFQASAQLNSQQIEAPTSMSELSSCSSSLLSAVPVVHNDDDHEDDELRNNIQTISKSISSANNSQQSKLSSSYNSSSESAPHFRGAAMFLNHSLSPPPGRATEGGNSIRRISDLPPRPMTALSYVSTTKVRNQNEHSPSRSSESGDDERGGIHHLHRHHQQNGGQILKDRALSQQALSRPRTPAPGDANGGGGILYTTTSSAEESDTGSINEGDRSVVVVARNGRRKSYKPLEEPREEKMQSLRKSRHRHNNSQTSLPMKPPRPTLVSTSHNEQVQDFGTFDRNSMRYNGQTNNGNYALSSDRSNTISRATRMPLSKSSSKQNSLADQTVEPKATKQRQANSYQVEDENFNFHHRDHRSQPLIDGDKNDLSNHHHSHRQERNYLPKQSNNNNHRPVASMSLSRGTKQQPDQMYCCDDDDDDDDDDNDDDDDDVDVDEGEDYRNKSLNGQLYYTSSRRPNTLSSSSPSSRREDGGRIYSNTLLASRPKQQGYLQPTAKKELSSSQFSNGGGDVFRSTSMRQVGRPKVNYNSYSANTRPNLSTDTMSREQATRRSSYVNGGDVGSVITTNIVAGDQSASSASSRQPVAAEQARRYSNRNVAGDNNSDSPSTRTWENPMKLNTKTPNNSHRLSSTHGKSSRSYSLRNVNDLDASEEPFESCYSRTYNRSQQQQQQQQQRRRNDFSSYNSTSSEFSSMEQPITTNQNLNQRNFVGSHQLDFDSQHRLNESGLPEVADHHHHQSINQLARTSRQGGTSSASYLGVSGQGGGGGMKFEQANAQHNYAMNVGRSPQITGRAMSQQSLTRPTMPLSSGRRRGAGGSYGSGSDVGGSSMSLVSRLQGRYENAHTRSPIVMYIPQAIPKFNIEDRVGSSSTSVIVKSSTLRKSSRSKQQQAKSSSRRSLSRNESDSESSSMLRTLVRPKNSRTRDGNYASKRGTILHRTMHDNNNHHYHHHHHHHQDDDEENKDNLGQLATEMDSYKFRRRYSVPKDAKINWFAKLRQRVSSGGK